MVISRTVFVVLTILCITDVGYVAEVSHKNHIELINPLDRIPMNKRGKRVIHKGDPVLQEPERVVFFDATGKAKNEIPLINSSEKVETPRGQAERETTHTAKISESGEHVGIIERIWESMASYDGTGEVLQALRTFRYYDSGGNLLWQHSAVGEQFSLSADGNRIGLVVEELFPLEEIAEKIGSAHSEARHSWGVVCDEKGNQVFKYDPGPNRYISYVGLSQNGKYATMDRVCIDVDNKAIHKIPYIGAGMTGIDDTGLCVVKKHIREHGADGKQKSEILYEHKF